MIELTPGTPVVHITPTGDEGVTGVILADDNVLIPFQQRRSEKPQPGHVFVLDDPDQNDALSEGNWVDPQTLRAREINMPAPGTRVVYIGRNGTEGVKGMVVADDDPRIPSDHRSKTGHSRSDYVYVLYDEPIEGGRNWEPSSYGSGGRYVDHGPTYGSWFIPDTLKEINS